MKRLTMLVLFALVLPAVGIVGGATPAEACDCGTISDARALTSADAVFVGKVIAYEGAPSGSMGAPDLWRFKVRQVYKGNVARTQEVISDVSGASCGLEIPERGTFLIFADVTAPNRPNFAPVMTHGQMYAHLCGGTRALSTGALEPGLANPLAPPGERPKGKTR